MADIFAFDSPEQCRHLLAGGDSVISVGGTTVPDRMCLAAHSDRFPTGRCHVVCWSRWASPDVLAGLAGHKGNAVLNDAYDSLEVANPFYRLCSRNGWTYVKHQRIGIGAAAWETLTHPSAQTRSVFGQALRLGLLPSPVVRLGPYSPTAQVVACAPAVARDPFQERPIDILFVGRIWPCRAEALRRFRQAAYRLRVRFEVVEGGLDPQKYIEILSQAKIALSLVGGGPRCRREWEILLAGTLLLNDRRLRFYSSGRLPLLAEGKDFVWEARNVESQLAELLRDDDRRTRMAASGQNLAERCFLTVPNVEWRLVCIYLHEKGFRWDGSYEGLLAAESRLGMSWPLTERGAATQ